MPAAISPRLAQRRRLVAAGTGHRAVCAGWTTRPHRASDQPETGRTAEADDFGGEPLWRVLKDPDIRQRIQAAGFEILADPPTRTADYLKSEVERWDNLVRKIGIKPE